MISRLLEAVPFEVFDYQTLVDSLSDYRHPRDRITKLLRSGDVIRVKKGLYVFGPLHRRAPYSRELLANLIYGPSYISLEYALSFYGLIPELAVSVTSVTTGRTKKFMTPAGLFTFRTQPVKIYSHGMRIVSAGNGSGFLMATMEKALCDQVLASGNGVRSIRAMERWLFDDMRIDPDRFAALSAEEISETARCACSERLDLLLRLHTRIGGMGNA
ncbi:MAG: hypothetical protein PHQ23_01700 [Candidatus Wallbacteria bacterium]|nr:hypothetical protein [Candidatus Wallbacteria bacterium]